MAPFWLKPCIATLSGPVSMTSLQDPQQHIWMSQAMRLCWPLMPGYGPWSWALDGPRGDASSCPATLNAAYAQAVLAMAARAPTTANVAMVNALASYVSFICPSCLAYAMHGHPALGLSSQSCRAAPSLQEPQQHICMSQRMRLCWPCIPADAC